MPTQQIKAASTGVSLSIARLLMAAFAVSLLLAGSLSTSAFAASPWWRLESGSRPTILPLGPCGGKEQPVCGQIVVTAANLGDANVNGGGAGGPVTITDKLPAGVHALSASGISGEKDETTVTCAQPAGPCQFKSVLPPYDQIEVRITVVVEHEPAAGEQNEAQVSGGETPGASVSRQLKVGEEATPFGVESYSVTPEQEGGTADTQAGSHPFQVTGALTLNQTTGEEPAALPKDLVGKLPPGLIGNPTPLPQCTLGQFLTVGQNENQCAPQTAVGVAMVTFNEDPGNPRQERAAAAPIFNLEPAEGEPARFGFLLPVTPVLIDASVRTGGDYGITLSSINTSQTGALLSFKLIFWGVPGSPSHDGQRGWGCLAAARGSVRTCNPLGATNPPPFLVLPTSCLGPLGNAFEADSWLAPHPAGERPLFAGEPMAGMTGCNALPFSPQIKVTPDGTAGSTPTGLNVDVHVPQDLVLCGTCLAESNVKDITVALPEGVAVNPASGDGLQGCSEALVGYLPAQSVPPDDLHFTATPKSPELSVPGVNTCPDASKIGEVTIRSPLLPVSQPLKGSVYLATQNENPFGSLIALYIVAQDPISGTLVKLAGRTRLTETGQLITTFTNTPQLAFEDAELHFFGGNRAPLASPARCLPYTTTASFVPWSAELVDEAALTVSSSSTFSVTSGPNGGPCPGASLPFSPSLTGGTTNINAGGFSPLTTTIGRPDGQQNMQSVVLHMPPGVSGLLAGVKLCPEAQANEGTCGPESLIGETTVSAGVGPDPVSVKGGKVYLTEHYGGAPFGLSIVNPVKAGPFDLEHDTSPGAPPPPACDCVVVRAKIAVDPATAALTITTDPSGPHAIPHLIDGIPVQIQKVNVTVNRPGFTFNPTSCTPMSITGAIASDEGATSPVAVPFQVANCANLQFKPQFGVAVTGKASRTIGAGLSVKLAYPAGAMGSEANIARVKVELPVQLPSRLTTLQKACLAATFDANPASCPPQSVVGHAKVITPLLPVPLEGPAYFVSHGGAAFPDLTIVLQGYGVTVDLIGTTFISKAGITSTTFKTTPDVPFNTFELTLPQGPFSALTANVNLCSLTHTTVTHKVITRHGKHVRVPVRRTVATRLAMPTEFTAQNGLTLNQSTPISVTGCTTAKNAKRARRARHTTNR